MKKVKIAQIGTAHDHAGATMNSLRKLSDDFDVVGAAEPVELHLTNLALQKPYEGIPHYTVDQLLQMELDAVAIECDEQYATGYAQMFADRGVAVHMDKPGSHGAASFAKLADTLRRQNLPFHLGYMYRYNPVVRMAFAEVEAGNLGEIYSVECQMSVHHAPAKRNWMGGYKGGMMYWLGCHLIDLIYRLQGLPEEVIPMNCCSALNRDDGNTSEDYGFAVLRYKNGVSFAKASAAEFGGFARRQCVISGTKGTIEIRPLEMGFGGYNRSYATYTNTRNEVNIWKDNGEKWESEPYDRYDGMMHSFAAMVRGEIENPYSYDYETELFRLIMLCCGAE